MSEEVIDRVDEMIRKNNIKYKDQQSQKAYEQALKQYEKHSKAQLTKQYAELVKEGNKKAIQKAKAAKKVQKKTKKKVTPTLPKEIQQQKPIQIPKKKMSEAEVNVINKTIQARAQRIIQQQQLQKLNKKLQEEKKRTKLYQLNQKCKKMLSKSHERIVSAKNLSEDKMNILKKLEDNARGQIHELDDIINNLIDKANGKNPKQNTQSIQRVKSTKIVKNKQQINVKYAQENEQYDLDNQEMLDNFNYQQEYDAKEMQDNFLDLNRIIFQKSSEELLKMDYIPI